MVLGVVPKERREALRLQHEAAVIRLGRHAPDRVLRAREVEVFFGFDLRETKKERERIR